MPTECTQWDINNDFRISPDQENPNRDSCGTVGVWEFMGSISLTRDPNTYYTLSTFTPGIGGYPGLDFWFGTYVDGNGQFPAIGFNGSGETRVFDGHITFPANAVDIHPGPSQMGIIAWHSPLSGYVSITGGVSDNDHACGDGILWYLDKDSTSLAEGYISNAPVDQGGSQSFENGSGGAGLNAVNVGVGETIYLAIHPNGNYICDNTKVELSIAVTAAATPTPLNGPTSTELPPPTVTPQPTSPPGIICVLENLLYMLLGQAAPGANHMASLHVMSYIQQAAFDIQLFHRVEDEILSQTAEGQRYIDLYYGHGAEITELLANNEELRNEAVATLQLWEPNLQALVDGEGDNVTITGGQVQAVQDFLDHLYALGSPELRQTIESELALNPLEQTVGMTMNQASVYLVDYQVEPTVTPTSTPGATETEPPAVTPALTSSPTLTPAATETPTETPTPTATETETPTATETLTPTETSTPTATPVLSGTDFYLHGTGTNANPAVLFLSTTAPSGSTAKYKDSTSVNFNNGNLWKDVGTWAITPAGVGGQLISLDDLHVWLGLKNSDDQGTRFDLRAEVYKNEELISTGETLCIPGITRNANQAKEVVVLFDTFDPVALDGAADSLSIKILTRIGTDGAGNHCGGHSSAVGLRLYFDASNRLSYFDGIFVP
jgi:hypothetical protein